MNTISTRFFIRLFFVCITTLSTLAVYLSKAAEITMPSLLLGSLIGLSISAALLALEFGFRKCSLLSFNTLVLGLFFGYFLGVALLSFLDSVLSLTSLSQKRDVVEMLKIVILLASVYLGVMITLKNSSEILLSLPFIKFNPQHKKTKEIVVDPSVLCDGRVIDLATSGLLDNRLVVPRFLLKELYELEESKEESCQSKARLSFEILRKLETLPDLHLQYSETDFPEVKESTQKILKLGRLLHADVLTADITRVQMASSDGVRIINLHALCNALKPLMERGEYLTIKIQRHGKEERQGVGYLEDGTMIVVNGGGDFMNKTIKASVLSVKHTSTGRMVFCNVAQEVRQDVRQELCDSLP